MPDTTTTPLPLQSTMVEYRVSGALDGVTPAPAIVLPPGVVETEGCRSLIVEVENLGLIDLTGFTTEGAFGDRFVRPLLIVGPLVPIGGDNVGIALDGEPSEYEITIPAGANGVYVESCIYVPQGHQLLLNNMIASRNEPIIVRIGIFTPDTILAAAKMREACCCYGSALNPAGQREYVTAIYANCALSISAVAPDTISRALGTQSVNVSGSGFNPTDVVAVIHEDGTDLIPVLSVTYINGNLLQVLLDVGSADLGVYDLTVAADQSYQLCSATLEGAIEITV